MLANLRRPALLVPWALLVGCNNISGADLIDTEGAGGSGPPPWLPVDGVTITEIAAYQGVRRSLEVGGVAASSNVPLVEGRGALVRVYTTTDPSFNGQPVTARLYLGDGPPLEVTGVPNPGSVEQDLATTMNFEIPGERLVGVAGYRIELLQAPELASGQNAAAVYPASGQDPLALENVGPQLRIRLVPIEYRADGSNRLPDTSEAQLQLFRDAFYGLYPVPAVTITVDAPMPYDGSVDPFGSGWDDLLNAMTAYRYQSAAAPDEYVYGIFAPADSMGTFCSGGCVAGLSMVAGPSDVQYRVGIGLGFTGSDAPETATHEIGHTHGRWHAPCSQFGGIDSVDPDYPYPDAQLGVWGYDLVTRRLFDPVATVDLMSYCIPVWISDYNYVALLERVRTVNGAVAAQREQAEAPRSPHERIAVYRDGSVKVLSPLELPSWGSSDAQSGGSVTLHGAPDGAPLAARGSWARYSDGRGGVLTFPRLTDVPDWISFEVDGSKVRLSRSQLTHAVRPHSTGML